jgi:hypothetical protein
MTAMAIARQHDSLGGKPGAVTPQGMLENDVPVFGPPM